MRSALAFVTIPILVLVAACGGNTPAAPTKTVTVTAPPATPSPSSFAGLGDPAASPPADDSADPLDLKIKDEVGLPGVQVTVFDYRRDIKDPDGFKPDAGTRWDEALIRICNVSVTDDDELTMLSGYGNWLIHDNDDGTYDELDLSPSPATQPQWNYDRKIRGGQCQKGWLGFTVPTKLKPTGISFGRDGDEEALWKLR